MQDIIVEKPYQFIPPFRSPWWTAILQKLRAVDGYLKRSEGIESYQLRGVDYLRESLRLGRSVLLTPNHCRYSDPLVMGWVARAAKTPFYSMASWHLFHSSVFQKLAMQAMGAFSVYREGVDRQSLDLAVEILTTGERPLLLFPEGAVFRTNDVLQNLLDGVSFMARTAAKKRIKEGNQAGVVIHPVAIKYLFHGNLEDTIRPVLDSIEDRLTWSHANRLPLLERIQRAAFALLTLKELDYLGKAQDGDVVTRQQKLIDHLLHPLEREWTQSEQSGPIIPRVKHLRMKILPDLIQGDLSLDERDRRWKHLRDIYLAQQVASYPPTYLQHPTTETRILETVERMEEDLTDHTTVHQGLEAIIEVGPAIEVPTDRPPRGEEDPLMVTLRERMQGMLDTLALESKPYVLPNPTQT